MDEYDRYAVGVYDILQSDGGIGDIAEYLSRVQNELMAKSGKPEHLTSLAEKIYRNYHRAYDSTAE